MTSSYRRDIKGSPYSLTPCEFGWQVTSVAVKTDRFYKTYLVQQDDQLRPSKCSCGDCVHRGGICKHMRALEELLQEIEKEGLQ
jgi:SWIM zinc finger